MHAQYNKKKKEKKFWTKKQIECRTNLKVEEKPKTKAGSKTLTKHS